jgi:hypothetical protein
MADGTRESWVVLLQVHQDERLPQNGVPHDDGPLDYGETLRC